jgi:hypothetical protein
VTSDTFTLGSKRFRVQRLPGNPIIVPGMSRTLGDDINGPSLVRVPEWVTNRLGRYYLYFAHHNGSHIRLAYADRLEGPWSIHEPGSLQHAESRFPAAIDPLDRALPPGFVEPIPHIASPDVHVDHAERRFRMYYHGILANRQQVTRVALSSDGIHFTAREEIVGNSYFRGFAHGDWHYGIAMPGIFYRSRDGLSGFESGPRLFTANMRHAAVRVDGDLLWVFFTNVGEDPPERILATTIDLRSDWMSWQTGDVVEVLRPGLAWEGADLPSVASIRGEISAPANQLRDPALFEDDGRIYLLYAIAGEAGLAIAELVST